jgi:predicted TIM-barrel fold metal-dependent hydrolase
MMTVDAQIHIWDANSPTRPWRAELAHRAHKPFPFTADMALAEMDAAQVDRAILVPPSWEGDRNDLATSAARRFPDRFAVMGRLTLQHPASRDVLKAWRAQAGMLGLRFTFHTPTQRAWLVDGTADWLWPAAERAGLPLMLFVPGSLDIVGRIAARHPGLRLILDHLAIGTEQLGAQAFDHLPELVALARYENVAVKASALPCHTSEAYPFRGLHAYIRQVYDAYGPRRTFWGSDLTRLPCPYRQAVTLFSEELPWLSTSDKQWIMGRALCEWVGWSCA